MAVLSLGNGYANNPPQKCMFSSKNSIEMKLIMSHRTCDAKTILFNSSVGVTGGEEWDNVCQGPDFNRP